MFYIRFILIHKRLYISPFPAPFLQHFCPLLLPPLSAHFLTIIYALFTETYVSVCTGCFHVTLTVIIIIISFSTCIVWALSLELFSYEGRN
jgi:hypothetical protein